MFVVRSSRQALCPMSAGTVSYTHLDVYKRQEQEAEAKREEQARQDRYQGILDRFISEGNEPVSYTHLDVYKRQDQRRTT